jgi:ligand-binding SRPBCC domain-containing protein
VPVFEATMQLRCTAEALFDFLARPANLPKLSPPDWELKLLDAPVICQLGSRLVIQARRSGIPQRIVSEITGFEPHSVLVDEMREGPLRKLVHSRTLQANGDSVSLTDHIEFEPPRGLMGLMLTAQRIEKDLAALHEFRLKRFQELLEPGRPG